MIKMRFISIGILFTVILLALFACEREFVYKGGEEGLSFSTDTVMFDTIFTSIGSTTKNFRVYNPYDQDMSIESIELANGDDSYFRLNIDGYPETQLNDVRLRANDSLFIFVEVTIDHVNSNTPIVVTDSIFFRTHEKTETVQLVAYGQDVVLMKKDTLKTQTLTKDKPYLIYDFIIVDTAQTVTIEPGASLYFYKDASLLVLGSLQANGTTEEPIYFSGHRLEDWYNDKPGQWGYIHLLPGSGETSFNNCIIKNGTMGIIADSVGIDNNPVEIHNTRIEHISTFGLLAQTSSLNVSNSVFGDCGNSSAALTVGGSYNFTHCTFANYFDWTFRTNPAVFLNNYYINEDDETKIVPLEEATFNNCLIYGNNFSELGFDFQYNDSEFPDADVSYQLNHCLVKLSENFDITDESKFNNVEKNKDPLFIDISEYNYQLDTLSAAKDMGDYSLAEPFPTDILGNNRLEDDFPDLGAYERIEKK